MGKEQRDEGFVEEYYRLAGYDVLTNLWLKAADVGGRDEADVVALNLDLANRKLEIHHVEVGQLTYGFDETKKRILKKFDERHQEALEDIMSHRYNLDDSVTVSYVPTYIYSYCSKSNQEKLKPLLSEKGIVFKSITSLYRDLPRMFEEYKQRMKRQGLVKTANVSLPNDCDRIYHIMRFMESMM
jgi:hypothetical protein